MLQIIGWILCLMLVIKALEINANPAFKEGEGEYRSLNGAAAAGAAFALIGAVIFAGWLLYQGQALNDLVSSPSSYSDMSTAELDAMARGDAGMDADAAADATAAAADAAMDGAREAAAAADAAAADAAR